MKTARVSHRTIGRCRPFRQCVVRVASHLTQPKGQSKGADLLLDAPNSWKDHVPGAAHTQLQEHIGAPNQHTTRRNALLLLTASSLALSNVQLPKPAVAADTSSAEAALDAALARVVKKTKAPVLLRLAFHDAGTYRILSGDGGPNGSIQFELDRPESMGLDKGWTFIQQLRGAVTGTAAEGLSDGDLVAAAGAYAVRVTGGPVITVPLGRNGASSADPSGRMLSEDAGALDQKEYFESLGLTLQEATALLGAHTLGNKGYGSPFKFDNTYFVELLKKPWLNTRDSMASMIGIPSDHVLPDDPDFLPIIQKYATDQDAFFQDFSAAYVKMTTLGTNLA